MPAGPIIDTDILIDVGRGVADAAVAFRRIAIGGPLSVSTITHMELLVGCRNREEQGRLGQFMEQFEVLALTDATCAAATDLLRRYHLSHGLLIPDALIAATALVSRRRLYSKNRRDFRFIEGLDLGPYPPA